MPGDAKNRRSSARIDVLIPAIEKDMKTLPHVIDAVRRYVKHPIGQILIVSPKSSRIQAMCKRKGCRFVNERTVLPITPKTIAYRSKTFERSGWLYQQLLKLSGDRLCKADYFLVIDADTVLIRPHVFRRSGKTLFYCRNWTQPEYYRSYSRLMGERAQSRRSFVTHYMLFERSKLAGMKRRIELKHGTRWYKAILGRIDRTKPFGFSEFETYGNYVYGQNRNGVILKSALNTSLHTSVKKLTPERIKRLAGKFRSVSFHERKAYSRRPGASTS